MIGKGYLFLKTLNSADLFLLYDKLTLSSNSIANATTFDMQDYVVMKQKKHHFIQINIQPDPCYTLKYTGNIESDDRMDILVEFLEVSIHCILYNRCLYPQGIFEKRTKYNVPVQMCLHPDVCVYITSVMDSLKVLLARGAVDKVSVVILQEDSMTPVERFIFEFSQFSKSWAEKDPHLFQAEQALRGFLLKLNVSDALLEASSTDKTWSVHVHTKNSTLVAAEEELIQKDFPWSEAGENEQTMKNPRLVPLRSDSNQVFQMQLYVEEEGNTER